MTVELLFSGALGPQPGGNVQLLFGATSTPPDPDPDPPIADPAPGRLRAAVRAAWSTVAITEPARASLAWLAGDRLPTGTSLPWGAFQAAAGSTRLPWATPAAVGGAVRLPWSTSAPRSASTRLPWGSSLPQSNSVRLPWGMARPVQQLAVSRWSNGAVARALVQVPWGQAGARRVWVRANASGASAGTWATVMPWGPGRLVESIGGPWTPPPLVPPLPVPCYVPDPGNDVLLLLRESLPTNAGLAALLFACRRASLYVIPIRRVYMVTNTTTLTRVSDGEPIECHGFSLSLDRDSWAWGFSASLPGRALPLLMPTTPGEPVELEAVVNGLAFRLIARSISRDRQFNDQAVRVEGVGHTAVLDSPYSAEQAFSAVSALTSQQLLDQALPYGWTADWQLTPWLVPGGLWSHLGTPASAARTIAAAGGGYVLPHPSALSFKVLPQYPVAPWDWSSVTPDLEVPAAVAIREGIEWIHRPAYNGVYVSGTAAGGVLRLVKRTGTAGDLLAPMVVDRLITHADAARQRGLPVLADTGSQAWVTLAMPVLPIGSVVMPGKFVRYVDGATARLGLVRGVRVDVTAGEGSSPNEVWQSIRLETHES